MEGTNWKINWSLFDSFVSEMMSCRVVREGVSDKRVHGLLYFLPPTGHGIRWARTAFEKMRWNQNISLKFNIFHNPCTQNRNLQGHWHWDNEKTAWQGAILKTILPFLSMERDIPSHHWRAHQLHLRRWTWSPWSPRLTHSPRRSCRNSSKMYDILLFNLITS